jgi:uncharacterized protein
VSDAAGEATVDGGVDPAPTGLLLVLQDLDIHIDQLAYRLAHHPARLALAELVETDRSLLAERRRNDADRSGLDDSLRRLETEVADCDSRIAAIERRLRTADAGSFRDQGAMATEIDSLMRRKRELEDEELQVMEALEPMDEVLRTITEREQSIGEQRLGLEEALAAAEAEIMTERSAAVDQRSEAAQKVPAPLLAEYERLRSRLGGIGAARLVHGTCSGCNLGLSATELDRIRPGSPDAVFHCEQCGRILVS